MRAVWYDRQGEAEDVLQIGELPDPEPGAGEVRVRVTISGVNPGDLKKRQGAEGSTMPYARVIPHSDGAGIIDAVGNGISVERLGRRVWIHGAQSYRAFGTAAELVVVPARLAIDLPDSVPDAMGACLGIPGITAHHAVFGDGPVDGKVVLVHGVLGGVGSIAAQLAAWRGAYVIGTVRRGCDLNQVAEGRFSAVVALDDTRAAEAIRSHAPLGVDRIIEVAFSENADLDGAVARSGTVIAAYATGRARPDFPFWPMLTNNVTIRLLSSDDFTHRARRLAVADLTTAAESGDLHARFAETLPLERVVEAHAKVAAGTRERILLAPCREEWAVGPTRPR